MSPWPGTPKSQQTPPINPPSVRFPFTLNEDSTQADVHDAIRTALNGLTVHEQAFANLPSQIASQAAAAAVAAVENISSEVVAGVTSFNARTGPVIYFPGLGTVNNQLGESSYETQQGDAGAKILVGDSGPVTVTLNSGVTAPWFTMIGNDSSATAILMPDSGAIYGLTSLNQGGFAIVFFDGADFWSEGIAGGGVVPDSGATGFVPLWVSPTALGNSHIDDGLTTAGVITSSEPLSVQAHSADNPGGTLTSLSTYAVFDGVGTGANALGFMSTEVNCINANSGEIQEVDGLDVDVFNSGSGTIDLAIGIFDSVANLGTGTLSVGIGLGVNFTSNNGVTSENDGIVIGTPLLIGGATVTLNRGLWIQEQAAAGIATSYALASDATVPSYFSGPVAVPILQAQTVYSAAGTPLPLAATAGVARAFVSDATANVYGAAYVSGGSITAPVYCDGTNWYMG